MFGDELFSRRGAGGLPDIAPVTAVVILAFARNFRFFFICGGGWLDWIGSDSGHNWRQHRDGVTRHPKMRDRRLQIDPQFGFFAMQR